MRKKQDKDLELLEKWIETYNNLCDIYGQCDKILGSAPDSPYQEPTWKLFENYTALIADKIGDYDNWLEWYLYDNKQGNRGLEAGVAGKKREIRTLKDLIKLLG